MLFRNRPLPSRTSEKKNPDKPPARWGGSGCSAVFGRPLVGTQPRILDTSAQHGAGLRLTAHAPRRVPVRESLHG
jgi:hypothetical protein